jgi:hypothetical protein
MGMRSTFLSPLVVTAADRCPSLVDCSGSPGGPGNSPSLRTVPQTDTGGLVEHTQARERTVLKELGKLPP